MLNLSESEFLELAGDRTVIPLSMELACDLVTPVGFFSQIDTPYSFILESVESSEQIGRYSFVGMDPRFVIRSRGAETHIRDFEGTTRILDGNPLDNLKELIKTYRPVRYDNPGGFFGGAVGYLSYDMITHIEPVDLENPDPLGLPDLYFILPRIVVIFDHFNHTVRIVYNAFTGEKDRAGAIYREAAESIRQTRELFERRHEYPLFSMKPDLPDPDFRSNMDPGRFREIVNRARESIIAGEAIQVVLSQRFGTPYPGSPLSLYRALRIINPSPYMFLINYPDFSLIGSSPEILVREENRKVTIRPIAGTRKRGETPRQDREAEKSLLSDEKEIAEHVMLVDLARNDIGRVCRAGSVKADRLLAVERYSHVMHIVSNVVGELDRDRDAFDLIRACFPAGTVSGAPKIRAMELIEELEPDRRGPYAGAVCYFDFGGNFDSCITIRTMVLKDGTCFIQAGAGIVFDSVAENEYQETLSKARALFKAVRLGEMLSNEREDAP
jgi:anthranilate synthase component 1